MNPTKRLFDKCGGYRKLHSFTFATVIHLGTIKFCKRFISWKDDTMHDYWQYFHEVKPQFDPWLESEDDTVVANAMIVLIERTMAMLSRQTARQGEVFAKEGGFRERLTSVRLDERDKQRQESNTPLCTECGKPMCKRTARSGSNAGNPFWGCSGYPDCKATQPYQEG